MVNLYLNGNTLDLNYFLIKFLYGKGEPAITSGFMLLADFFRFAELLCLGTLLFHRTFLIRKFLVMAGFCWDLKLGLMWKSLWVANKRRFKGL